MDVSAQGRLSEPNVSCSRPGLIDSLSADYRHRSIADGTSYVLAAEGRLIVHSTCLIACACFKMVILDIVQSF